MRFLAGLTSVVGAFCGLLALGSAYATVMAILSGFMIQIILGGAALTVLSIGLCIGLLALTDYLERKMYRDYYSRTNRPGRL